MARKKKDPALKVLSIDWDYFVRASMEQRMRLFPDGGNENMVPMLRNIVWAGRYAYPDLEFIGTKTTLKPFTEDLTTSIERHTPTSVWIVDSHAQAYQVIKDAYRKLKKSRIELVNIDFHHDVYGNDYDVNCGNWLRVLDHEYANPANSYTWVGYSDSDKEAWDSWGQSSECYGSTSFTTSLGERNVDAVDWDVIFLCRSDMWSPPHLDIRFMTLAGSIISAVDSSTNVMGQSYVLESRYEDLSDLIEQSRQLSAKCGGVVF